MKSRFSTTAAAAVGAALVLTGCSNSGAGGQGADGDQLTIVKASDQVAGLSPVINGDLGSLQAMAKVYEPLYTRDPKTNELEPALAEDYDTPDSKTWIFHLRKGVKFHDGTDFNADAVKYTYDQDKNNKKAVRPSLFDPIEKITAVDDYTVKIETTEAYAPLLDVVARSNLFIISPSADKQQDINQQPVGTGPYELDEWKKGDHLSFTSFDDYWGQPRSIKTLTLREVPDMNTAISLLETDEADLLTNIPSAQWQRVNSIQGVQTGKTASTGVSYLAMNTEEAPMNDINFRKAISHAINRDGYIDHIHDLGVRSDSYAGSQTFGYTESSDDKGFVYDEDIAKSLISENGWDGTDLTLLSSNEADMKDMVTYVQDALKKVGIDVSTKVVDHATFVDRNAEPGNELTMNSWTSSGNSILYDTLHSSGIGTTNVARFDNSKVDKLLSTANATIDDSKRSELLEQANLEAMDQAPWVVMKHDVITSAISDDHVDDVVIRSSGEVHMVAE